MLQQRTVRSLQEALRQPPESKPIPTLPPQFAIPDELLGDDNSQRVERVTVGSYEEQESGKDVISVDGSSVIDVASTPDQNPLPTGSPRPQANLQAESLAYILTLHEPSDLCSAAMFARQQRSSSTLPSRPAMIWLYPSSWETSPSPLHIAALTFLRDIQEEYSLLYHPC